MVRRRGGFRGEREEGRALAVIEAAVVVETLVAAVVVEALVATVVVVVDEAIVVAKKYKITKFRGGREQNELSLGLHAF